MDRLFPSLVTSIRTLKAAVLRFLRHLDDRLFSNSRKTHVLFVVEGLYGFLCQYPIIVELEKKPNLKIGITSVDKGAFEDIASSREESVEAIFRKYFIDHARAQYSKWNFIVDTHLNSFYPRRNAIRIGMHHGAGFGVLGSKVNRVKNYDIFFGFSSAERRFLNSIDPDIFSRQRLFFPIGSPKTDAAISQAANRRKRQENFSLPNKTTILITSHWVNISLLAVFQERVFEVLAKSFPELNIVQTGHPWMWKKDKDAETASENNRYRSITDNQTSEICEKVRDVEQRFQNAFFVPNVVAEELISIADILVVDHSSIIASYCLLDRPIVWYKHPTLEFSMPEMASIYDNASFAFSTIEGIVSACREATDRPEFHSIGRKNMRNYFYDNVGESAKYAAGLIADFPRAYSLDHNDWTKFRSETGAGSR